MRNQRFLLRWTNLTRVFTSFLQSSIEAISYQKADKEPQHSHSTNSQLFLLVAAIQMDLYKPKWYIQTTQSCFSTQIRALGTSPKSSGAGSSPLNLGTFCSALS